MLKMIGHGGVFSFKRTKIYEMLVRKSMKKFVKENEKLDLLISFDFSSSIADKTDIKTLLFCDWTIEYYIKVMHKREPDFLERLAIKRQDFAVRNADYVVTLFPNVYDYMKKSYGNVYYLGNVINSLRKPLDMTREEGKLLTKKRYENKHLLFIGIKPYKSAAESLIKAIYNINSQGKEKYYLDIIGMEEDEFTEYDFLKCYGYLDKGNDEQQEIYYKLINGAKFIVNTAENWVGASSIIEAMSFGVPIIVTPNPDIEKTFGKNIECGFYTLGNDVSYVYECIEKMSGCSVDEYSKMSINAQEMVKEYSWDSYICKIKDLIK